MEQKRVGAFFKIAIFTAAFCHQHVPAVDNEIDAMIATASMKLYRHFKNKPYKYLGVAKHSETFGELVLYEALYPNPEGKLWVRPKDMFHEIVEKEGKRFPRFASVGLRIETVTDVTKAEILSLRPLLETIFQSFDEKAMDAILENHSGFALHKALVDDTLVGFKLGYQHSLTTFYSWLGGIDPQYRGLGIASDLLKAQHDWCKEKGFQRIQTKTKNKWREMIILNVKAGFDIIGTYTDTKGEPKLILEKKLV